MYLCILDQKSLVLYPSLKNSTTHITIVSLIDTVDSFWQCSCSSSFSSMFKSMSSWMLFSPKSASDLNPSHLEPKEFFPHFRMQALPQGADETYIWKVRVLAWMRSKKSELFEALETSGIRSETLPRYRRKAAWQRASACMSTTWVCDLYGNMGCRVSKGGIQN